MSAASSPMADPPLSHWQATRGPLGLPSAELPATAEQVVIGGGLLGVAAAYWLARAGHRPLLIERGLPAAGATGRNGGFMVAGTAESYPDAIARHGHAAAKGIWRLTLDNRALLRGVLAEERIACDYREPGHLSLALSEAQRAELGRAIAAMAADGFPAELLDRQGAQELVGTPLAEQIVGGLYAAEDGLLHSARLIDGLAHAAVRHGARLCLGHEVLALAPEGDGVRIRTARGQVLAGRLLVAANAWLAQLAPQLSGLVRPVRGQVLSYQPSAPVFRLGMGAALTPTGEYWQQAPDGTIVLGGCRALAPGRDEGIYDSGPTDELQRAIEAVLPRLFPALGGLAVARRWAGLMAFTRDYMPIAAPAPGLAGAWLVGGFCGHGMPFGLRLGQLLAGALAGEVAPELGWFRLDRPSLRGAV